MKTKKTQPNRTAIKDLKVEEQEITEQEMKKVQGGRHQIRQETDNKVREMANETYVSPTKTQLPPPPKK